MHMYMYIMYAYLLNTYIYIWAVMYIIYKYIYWAVNIGIYDNVYIHCTSSETMNEAANSISRIRPATP